MIIRALYPWTEQWVPVSLRKDSLWWHDGPVGYGAKIVIDCSVADGELAMEALVLTERLRAAGYRDVTLRVRQEVGRVD